MSLVKRLNLHAPFRSFADGSDLEDRHASQSNRVRKRRRSPSSTGSYLEPAVLPVRTITNHEDRKASERHMHHQSHDGTVSESSSPPLQSSNECSDPPEKQMMTYEKRSRHKTKEDRYELKPGKSRVEERRKKEKKGADTKKRKNSKPQRTSGNALVHDFAARNVAPDRLTARFSHNGFPSRLS